MYIRTTILKHPAGFDAVMAQAQEDGRIQQMKDHVDFEKIAISRVDGDPCAAMITALFKDKAAADKAWAAEAPMRTLWVESGGESAMVYQGEAEAIISDD